MWAASLLYQTKLMLCVCASVQMLSFWQKCYNFGVSISAYLRLTNEKRK